MTSPILCACIQTNTGPDAALNTRNTIAMIEQAAAAGARLIALPEAVDLLDEDGERMRAFARPLEQHPTVDAFRASAKALGIWLLVGSVAARNAAGEAVNRCVFIGPMGGIVCHYDKIHLFDAAPGAVVSTESKIYARGAEAVIASLDWARIGLSICYDLRFPYLYRALALGGANVLAIPAAFMRITGEAHWHPLLRARAIENGCFVLAPAQCGLHYGSRYSYGRSLIVDPWGRVLAEAGEAEEIIYAELDFALIGQARQAIPSLAPERRFTLVSHVGGGA